MQKYAKWRFWLFWRFLVATFGCIIWMKLVAPIFHTEFDALQLLLKRFCKIPPSGYFGYFWWLLLAALFEWSLWHQFSTQNFMLYNFYLCVFSKFRQVAVLATFWAIFGGVIQMTLVIPIFHTKFDALQLLLKRFFEIPPSGDFGDFWWLLFGGNY